MRQEYHVEFKWKGQWRPSYGTYYSRESAEEHKKSSMFEIEADTGKKQKNSQWRVVSGPGRKMDFNINWPQWLGIGLASWLLYQMLK